MWASLSAPQWLRFDYKQFSSSVAGLAFGASAVLLPLEGASDGDPTHSAG